MFNIVRMTISLSRISSRHLSSVKTLEVTTLAAAPPLATSLSSDNILNQRDYFGIHKLFK